MVSAEYQIYQGIFTSDYNKNVRPDTGKAISGFLVWKIDWKESTDVLVALRFFTLLSVDQKEESMIFSGDFEMVSSSK